MSTVVRPLPAQSPFPVQSIPRSTSAKIEDQQGKLMAVGALVRFTNNQAYFILQHLDASIADKAVTLSAPDDQNPLNLRINAVLDQHPNRTFMPMYIQVHYNPEERLVLEHLVDQLAESTLGRYNLELRKNLTIDVFDSDRDQFLRDNAGFIVADKIRFQQITFQAKEAFAALKPSNDVSISLVTDDFGELAEFDATISNHNRSEFLKFLFSKNKVYAANWSTAKLEKAEKAAQQKEGTEEQQKGSTVAGYLTGSNESVMCVYAEEQAIGDALLAKYLEGIKGDTMVSICCTANNWPNLRQLSSLKIRPIYRRHTRAVPSNIKFERIFGLNVGLNIF